MILAVDPGTAKCGLAVLDPDARTMEKKVVETGGAMLEILSLVNRYPVKTVVIGEGTGSGTLKKLLSSTELPCDIEYIPEVDSTAEARERYFKENPPRGLFFFIPRGLIPLPGPVDDHAAVILGERYLKGKGSPPV